MGKGKRGKGRHDKPRQPPATPNSEQPVAGASGLGPGHTVFELTPQQHRAVIRSALDGLAKHVGERGEGEGLSPWGKWLTRMQVHVDNNAEAIGRRVAELSEKTCFACDMQVSAWLFLWVMDLLSHPLAPAHQFPFLHDLTPPLPTPSPSPAPPPSPLPLLRLGTMDVLRVELVPKGQEQGQEKGDRKAKEVVLVSRPAHEYLLLYADRVKGLCARQLAAILVCGAPSLDVFNNFSRESLDMRRHFAWSVPTHEALDLIAKHAPLVEVGAGSGYWASLLRNTRNTDIICYHTSHLLSSFHNPNEAGATAGGTQFTALLEGGPEALKEHKDRALLLMWPDYMGKGTFGKECIERFEGEVLVAVGEWEGRTWGAYAPGLPQHGQSFSKEAQQLVEERFECVQVCRIPNWPLFLDVVMVWKRKHAA